MRPSCSPQASSPFSGPRPQALLTALGPVYARRHVSTHVLLACISKDDRVQEFLAAYDLTAHVIRQGLGEMDEEPGKVEVALAEQEGRSLVLSTAGAAALARCQEQPSVTGSRVSWGSSGRRCW
ncbi:hypothetical protein ACIOG8_27235 [Streptomyces erythrochromogenes]|uniref:hypothetical protein n=1 Tax=Streptomyces erythrochromogenes TaxID=285574 RepID=UPI003802D066